MARHLRVPRSLSNHVRYSGLYKRKAGDRLHTLGIFIHTYIYILYIEVPWVAFGVP